MSKQVYALAAAAIIAIASLGPSPAKAQDDQAPAATQEQGCAPNCGTRTKTVRVRGEQIGTKEVPVYRYRTKTVKVSDCGDNCNPPPKAVQIQSPPPIVKHVEQPVIVVHVPKVQHVPAQISVAPNRCCPPGGRETWLPACPPNRVGSYGNGSYMQQQPTHLGEAACLRVGGVKYTLEGNFHRCYNARGERLRPDGSIVASN